MNWGTVLLASLLAPTLTLAAGDAGYRIKTQSGMVYGPGLMPETPFQDGEFTHVTVDASLSGVIAFFNNGKAEPNIPGEKEIWGEFRGGVLSNGVPFNEHLHGGIIDIGQGALRMLAVVAGDGPSKGGETYRVDERLNWRWQTDLALDPGYAEGLVITNGLNISSGVLWLGQSWQSEAGNPGGIDRASFIPSGGPVVGHLGDRDDDGFIDATMIGASRVPLDFLFVPGAPLLMTRTVSTDIPVSPVVAGLLELASVANLRVILNPPAGMPQAGSPLADYYARRLPDWAEDFAQRARHADERLRAADSDHAALAARLAKVLTAATQQSSDLAGYKAAISGDLKALEQALPALRARFTQLTAEAG